MITMRKNTNPTCKIRALLALLIVLALSVPAAFAAPIDEEISLGYLAASGAKLNPFLCNERDMVSINSLIYESLFELDENQQPQPLLAETWTQEDTVWTIRIRSGVLFHNGVELVAQDVVESYSLFKRVGESNPYNGRLSLISDMEVEDTFVISVTAKYPGMLTLYALTFPIVQRNTLSNNVAMGTGPFWCLNYVEDQYVHLEANPYWWKQQPSVTSLTFYHYWSIGDMLAGLQSGDIQMLQTRSTASALTKKLAYATALDYSTTTYEIILPNLAGAMSDLNVRKAVMYAIDYNTLISNVYLDMAQQCEVPISPGSWLYESRSAVYYYSPERALQLLNAAGWIDLTGDTLLNKVHDNVLEYLDLEILVYDEASSNVRSNAAKQIAANLQTVGIRATIKQGTRSEVRKAMSEGNFDLALVAMNLSEVPNLVPLLSSKGDLNYAVPWSQTTDDLMIATLSAATEQEMKLAYSDLQMYIVENLPVMGICFRTGMVLSTRPLIGLTGIRETDAYNGIEFMK